MLVGAISSIPLRTTGTSPLGYALRSPKPISTSLEVVEGERCVPSSGIVCIEYREAEMLH